MNPAKVSEMQKLGVADSVQGFMTQAAGAHELANDAHRFFCRGQASASKKLRPKIGRYAYTSPQINTFLSGQGWESRFNAMFQQFEREYIAHHPRELSRKIDKITLAQHYGLATPLLDWTLNPLVALYFACESRSNETGIVFLLIANGIPAVETDNDLGKIDVQQVRPIRFDQRMINQDAVFTFHPNPIEDFADTRGKSCSGILIPPGAKRRILDQLECIGFHRGFIYPGLQSTCERIDRHGRHERTFASDIETFTNYAANPELRELLKAQTPTEELNDDRLPYFADTQ